MNWYLRYSWLNFSQCKPEIFSIYLINLDMHKQVSYDMSYPFPFFFRLAFGVSASSWTHISRRRSSPLIPRFFRYFTTVFPVFYFKKEMLTLQRISFEAFSQKLKTYLPIRQCSFSLACSCFIFRFDNHNSSFFRSKLMVH